MQITMYDGSILWLSDYIDMKAEERLDNGMVKRQLSFRYPISYARILEESIIDYGGRLYAVKEIETSGVYQDITAKEDTYDISGKAVLSIEVSGTAKQCADAALNETGWSCTSEVTNNLTSNISMKNTDAMSVLEQISKVFLCEVDFDTEGKTVMLKDAIGDSDSTVRFETGVNVKKLSETRDTYDFANRLYPLGDDGLTITSINKGLPYMDKETEIARTIEAIWEETSYSDPQELMKVARLKLNDISTVKVSYSAEIIDLPEIYGAEYESYRYNLGDMVTVIDKNLEVNTRKRIMGVTRYERAPEKNTVELSDISFEDALKKLLEAQEALGKLTNGNVVIGANVDGMKASQIEGLEIYYTEPLSNTELSDLLI